MNNTFFATKVSIVNEFKLLADKIGANWDDALYGFASDGRIGDSHLHVPGPDGRLGYGGTCFPKDVNALLSFAKENGVNLNTIEGGWKTNLEVRPERDWEKIKGEVSNWFSTAFVENRYEPSVGLFLKSLPKIRYNDPGTLNFRFNRLNI